MKRGVFIIFCMLLFIGGVNAESCDSNDIERLKELAQEVSYKYEYANSEHNRQLYYFTFENIPDGLFVEVDGITYYDAGYTIGVGSGTFTFNVYSSNCNNKKITSVSVELPLFNEFSLTSECKKIGSDNLDVCDSWFQGEISVSEFGELVNNYFEEHDKINKDILYYFSNYWVYGIIGVTIILILILIMFKYRKNKSVLK